MPSYIEKIEELSLPVVALRGTVAFPAMTVNFEPPDEEATQAVQAAASGNAYLFLTSYDELCAEDEPFPYYRVGTVAKIKQMLRTPEGKTRIITEGNARATVTRYRKSGTHVEADLLCKRIQLPDCGGVRGEAYVHELLAALEKSAAFLPTSTDDLMNAARLINDPAVLSDFIASNIFVRDRDKQAVLECFDPFRRAETTLEILASEASIMAEEAIIRRRDEGGWETLQESLPNGDTMHAFIRQLATNPVTGRTALVVVVLTVM